MHYMIDKLHRLMHAKLSMACKETAPHTSATNSQERGDVRTIPALGYPFGLFGTSFVAITGRSWGRRCWWQRSAPPSVEGRGGRGVLSAARVVVAEGLLQASIRVGGGGANLQAAGELGCQNRIYNSKKQNFVTGNRNGIA